MWKFERLVRIDYQELSDKFYPCITLSNDGVEESFFLKFDENPNKKQILEEANKLVDNMNEQLETAAVEVKE